MASKLDEKTKAALEGVLTGYWDNLNGKIGEYMKNFPYSISSSDEGNDTADTTYGENTSSDAGNTSANAQPTLSYAAWNAQKQQNAQNTYQEQVKYLDNYRAQQLESINANLERRYADADRVQKRSVVDARASAEQNKANYGANADTMTRMGLTGSGYSDYISSQAYAQSRNDIQSANALNASTKADADYAAEEATGEVENTYISNMMNAKEKLNTTVSGLESDLMTYNEGQYNDILGLVQNGMSLTDAQAMAASKGVTLTDSQLTALTQMADTYTENQRKTTVYSVFDAFKAGTYSYDEAMSIISNEGLTLSEAEQRMFDAAKEAKLSAEQKAEIESNAINGTYTSVNELSEENKVSAQDSNYNTLYYEHGGDFSNLSAADMKQITNMANNKDISDVRYREIKKDYNESVCKESFFVTVDQNGAETYVTKQEATERLNEAKESGALTAYTQTYLESRYDKLYTVKTSAVYDNIIGDPIKGTIKYSGGAKSERKMSDKGQNFNVSLYDNAGKSWATFFIQSGGKVDDKLINSVADAVSNDTVFRYNGKIYIKRFDNVYLIERWSTKTDGESYNMLVEALNG